MLLDGPDSLFVVLISSGVVISPNSHLSVATHSDREGQRCLFLSLIFETANSSPEKYLLSFVFFVCLFVGGPRETLYMGRDVTRRQRIQMSAAVN